MIAVFEEWANLNRIVVKPRRIAFDASAWEGFCCRLSEITIFKISQSCLYGALIGLFVWGGLYEPGGRKLALVAGATVWVISSAAIVPFIPNRTS